MSVQDVTEMKRQYRTAKEGELPQRLVVSLEKESELRYGENPNQVAALYKLSASKVAELVDLQLVKSGKGGMSATNLMDVTRALDILKFFDQPSVAVMKHCIPSGFATQWEENSLVDIYKNARDADARSAFGSVVVFNCSLDLDTAREIMETYVEMVVAPRYEEGVMEVFEKKKDMRVLTFSHLDQLPKFVGDNTEGLYDLKSMPTGRVIAQAPYLTSVCGVEDLALRPMVRKKEVDYIVQREPSVQELQDLLTAWYVNIGVRSNGVVIVKNGVTLAVGSGQQERVGAVEQAIVKAYQKALDREGVLYDAIDGAASREKLSSNPLQGAVVSSDAFFPFRDSVDLMAKHGITAVIQPGGSVRDNEVIVAVNEHRMAMPFTLERCFAHF